jgi:hypothetical protein
MWLLAFRAEMHLRQLAAALREVTACLSDRWLAWLVLAALRRRSPLPCPQRPAEPSAAEVTVIEGIFRVPPYVASVPVRWVRG